MVGYTLTKCVRIIFKRLQSPLGRGGAYCEVGLELGEIRRPQPSSKRHGKVGPALEKDTGRGKRGEVVR